MSAPGAGQAGTSALRTLRQAYASPLGNHLALDPPGVLLVLERRQVELDDALLPVERVPAPDRDVRAGHLDHVVTRPRGTPETQTGHRAGADDEEVLQAPRIGNVLVPRKHEIHT